MMRHLKVRAIRMRINWCGNHKGDDLFCLGVIKEVVLTELASALELKWQEGITRVSRCRGGVIWGKAL